MRVLQNAKKCVGPTLLGQMNLDICHCICFPMSETANTDTVGLFRFLSGTLIKEKEVAEAIGSNAIFISIVLMNKIITISFQSMSMSLRYYQLSPEMDPLWLV